MIGEISSVDRAGSGEERFRPWQRLRGQRAFRRERNVGVYRHSAAALVRILPPWEGDIGAGQPAGEVITAVDRGVAGKVAAAGSVAINGGDVAAARGANGGGAVVTAGSVAGANGRGTGRRLGVVASRKVGNAVVRNRAKRMFREVFRLNQQLLPVDCDVLVIVRKDFASAQRADVEALFADAARRARRAFGAEKGG